MRLSQRFCLAAALAAAAFSGTAVLHGMGTEDTRAPTPTASQAVLARAPQQTGAPPEALGFSDRALEVVRLLAEEIGSRPAGTEAEERAAEFLADQFQALGYHVELAPFSFTTRIASGTSQNVVARHPDEDPEAPLVIVGAHYDSVVGSPGANDNASGTATVLELARDLEARPIEGVAIRYVAFGAEEVGLFGSQNFVARLSAPDRRRLRLAMSIDMMAVGDRPAFHGSEPWVSHAMARAWSQGYDPVRLPSSFARLSDHAPFLEAGLPAIMFHWLDDPCWHQSCDVADRVQWEALELMGAIAVELIRLAPE